MIEITHMTKLIILRRRSMKNMQMMKRYKPSILLIIFLTSSSVIILLPLLLAVTLQLKDLAVLVHTRKRNAGGTVDVDKGGSKIPNVGFWISSLFFPITLHTYRDNMRKISLSVDRNNRRWKPQFFIQNTKEKMESFYFLNFWQYIFI